MTPTTLIMYVCSNPDWPSLQVETEELLPTPERALEIYKEYLKETPQGKDHPDWIERSTVDRKPVIISGVMLCEEKVLKLI